MAPQQHHPERAREPWKIFFQGVRRTQDTLMGGHFEEYVEKTSMAEGLRPDRSYAEEPNSCRSSSSPTFPAEV